MTSTGWFAIWSPMLAAGSTGRHVLVSPYALGNVSSEKQNVRVDLSKKQIEGSPALDRHDRFWAIREFLLWIFRLADVLGWSYMWGAYPYIARDWREWKSRATGAGSWDPHLRSTSEVSRYHIEAEDGAVGHVEDFVIDDETWAIRYLIVDTRNWWPGKEVLIAPQWIERVSWSERKVHIRLSREAIKRSPEFTGEPALTRNYEEALHRHYNRRGYWDDEAAVRAQVG